MAFKAKDGKEFSMSSRMRAHNRGIEEPEEKGDPLEPPEGMEGEPDGDEVAAEHGPAHEVHHTHDHEGGMHHVHSVHPDGYEHHSDHGSVEEALEHHRKVAGASHEEPDGDEGREEEYEEA